jgi:hypothetical protein
MNSSRSRTMRGSLGDSWGDADYYQSDGDASLHSASALSDAGSQSDYDLPGNDATLDDQDMTTPLASRANRASSQTMRKTPTKTPARGTVRQPRNNPEGRQATLTKEPPSFIMPSMRASIDEPHSSDPPLRQSQLRTRRARQPSRQTQLSSTTSSRSRKVQQEEPPGQGHYLSLLWGNFVKPISLYVLEIVWYAMNYHLKPLLGTALTVFVLMSAIHFGSNFLQNYVQNALTPFCIIPGSSYLLPFCSTASTTSTYSGQYPDFQELAKVQSTFEEVLEANKDSYALPATLKKGEMALRDLRSTVKYSRLPSRNELEVELSSFIETASEASDHLSKYNAKIGYTMDQGT